MWSYHVKITSAYISKDDPVVTLFCVCLLSKGFPGGTVIKNPPANAGDRRRERHRFDPWVRKIP